MDKHSKRSASIFRYPVLIAFTLFFAGLFLLDLVTPDRAYSELENTTLSQRPSLSSVSMTFNLSSTEKEMLAPCAPSRKVESKICNFIMCFALSGPGFARKTWIRPCVFVYFWKIAPRLAEVTCAR